MENIGWVGLCTHNYRIMYSRRIDRVMVTKPKLILILLPYPVEVSGGDMVKVEFVE